MPSKRGRSAITGKFMTVKAAQKQKNTSVVETKSKTCKCSKPKKK